MKVKVKNTFIDKFNRSRVYSPGDVVEFDDERAKNIVALSLGEYVKEKVEEVPERPKPRKKKAE